MNKQEIEQKLEDIILSEQGVDFNELLGIARNSFNLALDIAAENVKTNSEDCKIWNCEGISVDKESILKYKL